MRARWLKPEFFTDKKIAELGPIAALVYEALWVIADDGGTAKGDADTLKSQVFYRWSMVTVRDISRACADLARAGRIRRYRIGDDEYSIIVNFDRHQKVHKPGKFRYPRPEKGAFFGDSETAHHEPPQAVTEYSAGDSPELSPGSAAHRPVTGTSAAHVPASPPPRLLDSKTPRLQESAARDAQNGEPPDAPLRSEPAPTSSPIAELVPQLEALVGVEHFPPILEFLRRRKHATWPAWIREMQKLVGPGSQFTAEDLASVCADDAALDTPISGPFALRSFLGTQRRERLKPPESPPGASPNGSATRPTPNQRGTLGEATYAAALAALEGIEDADNVDDPDDSPRGAT